MSYSDFDFQTTTYGKWILAGEHAVLRGHGALVFPILSKRFELKYTCSKYPFTILFEDEQDEKIYDLLKNVLLHGLSLVHKSEQAIDGNFFIKNSIPIGVGMGASAALCVAVSRWFSFQKWIAPHQEFSFAKELEHLFHGKSSGLDIVGVSSKQGQFFQNGKTLLITQHWHPQWVLSACGQKSRTVDCISKVQALWNVQPTQALAIDEAMHQSVEKAKQALTAKSEQTGFPLLVDSIQQALECFEKWGLVNDQLSEHMQLLIKQGARAVKPTGSGDGGYVLSLWTKEDLDLFKTIHNQSWIVL